VTNAGIGIYRGQQGVQDFKDGNFAKAMGEMGEATLRLAGVPIAVVQNLRIKAVPTIPAGVFRNNLTGATLAEVERVQSVLLQIRNQAVQNVAAGNGRGAWATRLTQTPRNSQLYGATFGNAVNEEINRLIALGQSPGGGLPGNLVVNSGTAKGTASGLTNSYNGARPDVRLPLGNGREAIWDFTTKGEAGKALAGHAGTRYSAFGFVDYIADIPY